MREGLYEEGEFKNKPEYIIEAFNPETDAIAQKIDFEKYLKVEGIPDDKKIEEITKSLGDIDLEKTAEMQRRI